LAWGWTPVFLASAGMAALTVWIAQKIDGSLPEKPLVKRATDSDRTSRGILFVTAVTGASFGTLLTFVPTFALERGSERVAGYFIGYTIGALVVRLAFGGAADRVGRPRVAQLSLVTYGVVAAATCLLRPGLLEILGVGFGVAHGFAYPALAAIVAERSHPERRGRALSDFNAAFNGGAGVSVMGAGFLVHGAGYPPVFLLIGCLALFSSRLLALRVRRQTG
jgi:MFS family permease